MESALDKIDRSNQLLREITECLKNKDTTKLKTYILEQDVLDETIYWDLTSEICKYLTGDMQETSLDFFEACEACLAYLVRTGKAKEMILALLEQTDCGDDDVKFVSLLELIQATLMKLLSKRFHSLELTLETLSAHIESLEPPANVNLEHEERLLLDGDRNVVRSGIVMQRYLKFLEPFVKDVSVFKSLRSTKEDNPQVLSLKKYLMLILECPFVYLDLTYNSERAKSESRCLAEKTMLLLSELERDFHRYLEVVRGDGKRRMVRKEEKLSSMEIQNEENEKLENESLGIHALDDEWQVEKSVSQLSQACLAYLVYVEQQGLNRLPCTLNQRYLLEFNFPYIALFLKRKEYLLIHKGALLLQHFVMVLNIGSLVSDDLDNSAYMSVISDLVSIMIHCPVMELRQLCKNVLTDFIQRFDTDGKYKLFFMIVSSLHHSGLHGFITQLLKNEIDSNLNSAVPRSVFLGNSLYKILQMLMKLQDGPTTDLLDNSDRIIAVLNLLRFLVIRDKPCNNASGVWTHFSDIEKSFLDPLRAGLEICKRDYKLELDTAKGSENSTNADVSVTVAGSLVPSMPMEQRLLVLQSAVVTFDVMDSVLSRLIELKDQQIAEFKKQIG